MYKPNILSHFFIDHIDSSSSESDDEEYISPVKQKRTKRIVVKKTVEPAKVNTNVKEEKLRRLVSRKNAMKQKRLVLSDSDSELEWNIDTAKSTKKGITKRPKFKYESLASTENTEPSKSKYTGFCV